MSDHPEAGASTFSLGIADNRDASQDTWRGHSCLRRRDSSRRVSIHIARLGPSTRQFGVLPTIRQVEQKQESKVLLHSEQMRNTITVRLPADLAVWLEATSKKANVPRGRIIREQLELARRRQDQPFMHLVGSVEGARDLSARKGFAKR